MNAWTRRALGIVVLLCLGGLAVVGGVYRVLWMRYEQGLAQFESRSERIDGVILAGPAIEKRMTQARDMVAPMLQANGPNAENDIQQKLREIIASSGATLVSSQAALEPVAEGKYVQRYKLTATVTGEWGKLVRLMERLQTHAPPFWIQSVSILREGLPTGAQNARLTVQLEAPLAPAGSKP